MPPAAPFPMPSPAPRYTEGMDLYRAGDKEGALAAFARLAGDHPGDAQALYFHGLLLFQLGRYGEAIVPLQRSLALVPAEDACIKLAMAQGQTGDLEGCLATLEAGIRSLPSCAALRAYLGTTLRSLGRLDEALEAYGTALALDPHHVPALWGLGLALGMAERPEEGMSVLRRAIDLDPAFPPPHFHLGVLAWTAGDPGETRRQEALLRDLAPSYAQRLAEIMATERTPQ